MMAPATRCVADEIFKLRSVKLRSVFELIAGDEIDGIISWRAVVAFFRRAMFEGKSRLSIYS
jgi:hypothetical protein